MNAKNKKALLIMEKVIQLTKNNKRIWKKEDPLPTAGLSWKRFTANFTNFHIKYLYTYSSTHFNSCSVLGIFDSRSFQLLYREEGIGVNDLYSYIIDKKLKKT